MSKVAKHIIFKGRVQGVGFRFTVFNIANRYQLDGQVRNIPDGSVEMIAQGHPDDIADCIRDIEQSFADYVRETKFQEITIDPKYNDFKITF